MPSLFQCRLCLNYTEYCYSLFDEDVVDIIENYTSIKITEDDDLPSTCCSNCLQDIHSVNSICIRIVASDKFLRNASKEIKQEHDNSQGKATENVNIIANSELETNKSIEEQQLVTDNKDDYYPREVQEETKDLTEFAAEESKRNLREAIDESCSSSENDKSLDNEQPITINPEINIELKKRLELKRLSKESFSKQSTPKLSFYSGMLKEKYQKYHCFDCGTDYNERKLYLQHAASHKNTTCTICNAKCPNIQRYIRHMDIHQSGQQICDICGAIAKNIESLRGHMFYMHKNSADQYKCDQCSRVFRFKYKYNLHVRKYHVGLRTHCCEICGKGFFTFRDLKRHTNMTHNKLRPFVCEHCGKAFSSKNVKKIHVRQHTNETPYRCDVCAEGFRQKVSLKSHLKSKHGIVLQQPKQLKVPEFNG